MSTPTATTTENPPRPDLLKVKVPAWTLLVPIVLGALLLLIATQQPDGRLHIWVLNVGQGDARTRLRTEHHEAEHR